MSVQLAVQAVFSASSNISKDRTVNGFHFIGDGSSLDHDIRAAASKVSDFYSGHTGAHAPVSAYLATDIARAYSIKVYNLADPKPRLPVVYTAHLATFGATRDLPTEVALCASYYSVRNLPRHRGRLYVGPFNLGALETAGTGPARPISDLLDSLKDASIRLAENQDGVWEDPAAPFSAPITPPSTVTWVIHSTVANTFEPIVSGWIDNSFDTQRRRGPAATNRTIWGPVI